MRKFSTRSVKKVDNSQLIRFNNYFSIEYNEKNNLVFLKRNTGVYHSRMPESIKIIPGKSIINEDTNNEVTTDYIVSILDKEYGAISIDLVMLLFNILRNCNWEWRKQYNTNISYFTKGFKNQSALIRIFIILLRTPAFILALQELKKYNIIENLTSIIPIDNLDGTNLNSIFYKNKGILSIIKSRKSLKQYELKYAIVLSDNYKWSYENSIKILKLFKSTEFSPVYKRGLYYKPLKYELLCKLANNYSFEKVYNYFNKYYKDESCKYSNIELYIIDVWKMLKDLKLLTNDSKIPIIPFERAEYFHNIIVNYYNNVFNVIHKTKSFRDNTSKASNYMNFIVNDYTFSVIRSRDELNKEGYSQSNCVASYYDKVESGNSIIVSMRKTKNTKNSFITIEVQVKNQKINIIQMKGKYNRDLIRDECEIVDEWLKLSNERLKTYLNDILKINHQDELTNIKKNLKQSLKIIKMNNIPKSITEKIGKNLHLKKNHPVEIIKNLIYDYFGEDFYKKEDFSPYVKIQQNFDELRIRKDHPSRSATDTYYLNDDTVLRTQTSAHQTEMLKSGYTSFLVTGDVYRKDTIDSSHYPVFHQMEGVHLCDNPEENLKATLVGLVRYLFPNCEYRINEDYFPFTEPSFEIEVKFEGEWLEILGCGVIHHEILENCNIDQKGWAFGLGLDRLAMILFKIPDIRYLWSDDERFISQFSSGNIVEFKEYSKYPPVYKDVAYWVSDKYHYNDFSSIVREEGGDLIEKIILLDEFTNKIGKTSNCHRIVYRSNDKVLTNENINKIQDKIRKRLSKELMVELR